MDKIVELNAVEQDAVGGAGLWQDIKDAVQRALDDYINHLIDPQI